jgi:hypothetical protein
MTLPLRDGAASLECVAARQFSFLHWRVCNFRPDCPK